MFILKKGHQPGVYVPLRALFLVNWKLLFCENLQQKTLFLVVFDIRLQTTLLLLTDAYLVRI